MKAAKITLGMSLCVKMIFIFLFALFGIVIYMSISTEGGWGKFLNTITMNSGRDNTIKIRRGDEIPEKLGLAPLVDLPYLGEGWAKLGFFNIKLYDMPTKTTFRIEFELEGETMFGSKSEFQKFMDSNYRMLREQVGVIVRSVDQSELADPKHRILSWKLMDRVNRIFGHKVLQNVRLENFDVYSSIEGSGFVKCELQQSGM